MRNKPWIDKEGEGALTLADELFHDAIEGLREYYPCLHKPTVVAELRHRVKVPDTGNNQLDYENVRDQVERLANEQD